jgi:hypothetical protein
MPATHDVQINGNGYMLVPGTYTYKQKGSEAAAFRTGLATFETKLIVGAGGALVVDRDAVRWQAQGLMPVPPGWGNEAGRLVLVPIEVTAASGVAANFDVQMQGSIYQGNYYFSNGANLYKIAAGAYTVPTLIGAAGGTITGMAVMGGLLYMATTAAGTMSNYAGSGVIVNTPAAPAGICWGYASGIWRSKGNNPSVISGSIDGGATWTDFQLDSTVMATTPWRGRATGGGVMLIATQRRLWELSGVWSGSPAAFTGTVSILYDAGGGGNAPDDFTWLQEYAGAVYTFYGGTVCKWDGVRLLPVPGAPRGGQTYGCVSGGLLCVSYGDFGGGAWCIACFDGTRWFYLKIANAATYVGLCGTDGQISDGHLMAGQSGSKTISRWQMPGRVLPTTVGVAGKVIIGPLDAGQGDAVKVWTEVAVDYSAAVSSVGVALAVPPGGLLQIDYSTDDGQTYATAGTPAIAAGSRSGSIVQALASGAGVEAARLLLRVTWFPTSNYPAWQLDGVWASGYKIVDKPREEMWEFDLHLTDRLIKRDGSVDARTGEQMLTALRTAAQNRLVFAFQDLDFDLSARTVNARVIEFSEKARKGDGTRYMESVVHLKLAAVN